MNLEDIDCIIEGNKIKKNIPVNDNYKYSYSKLQSFDSCPQKYKINYINKIRKPNESIEAFMGKRVHEVLDWHYKKNDKLGSFITIDVLLDKYNNLWNVNWHNNIYSANLPRKYKIKSKTKEQVYQNGIECLVNYFNRYNPSFNKNIIATELRCTINLDGITFNGIIDRVDKTKNGLYEIYDYKTGKKQMTQNEANNNLQLFIYQLAIQKDFPDCKNITLNWYYLKSNKIISVEHTKEKINELKKVLKKKILDIQTEKIFKAKESLLCEWCYFWDECEIKTTSNPAFKLD